MKLQTSPQTLGYWAYLAIDKHFHKILKHEPDVLDDRHPEALHQMRVGMRRLRSAVTGFAPALDLPKSAQNKQIGRIARRLGKLRDLDVLQEALETRYQPTLPKSEQKILNAALDYLEKQRRQALEAVQETLKHKNYKQFKQSLETWLEQPSYLVMAQMPIQEVLPGLLLPQVSNLLLHPGWLVGTEQQEIAIRPLQQLNHEAVEKQIAAEGPILHELRKETKRVRYLMELFTDFYGATYAAYLKDMKAIQEILGQIQDSFVLAEFLTEALPSQKNLPPTLAEQLKENRYQAWQQWQILQIRYLNPEIRRSFHSELLRPSKEPIDGKVGSHSEAANGAVNLTGG